MRLYKIAGTIILGVSAIAFTAACSDVVAAQADTAQNPHPVAATKQARFKVDGMTCSSCNVAVKVAAERVNGVSKAGASHEKKTAWAVYDPSKTSPKAIAAAITEAGYPASLTE